MTTRVSRSERRPILVAHRGWSARFAENSAPAFAAAIAAGADEIELDVRVSADGGLFVCHDDTLERVSDLSGPAGDAAMTDLRTAGVRMPDGTILPGLGFTTLDDVLTWFGRHVVLNLHVKEGVAPSAVLAGLERRVVEPGMRRHYVAGDAAVLATAMRRCPDIPRCLVSSRTENVPAMLATAVELGCERVQFFHGNCDRDDVHEARTMGLITNYYFADDVETAETLLAKGIDALLTNDIGVLRRRWPA
jgi:glycerophosphoryl diester phosphodiesterase